MSRPVLAAIASQPGRPLELVLQALLPQVDQLAVYLNGYPEVPAYVRALGRRCWVIHSPENLGAERKLAWSDWWDGIYLACDDDIAYPWDYAARMHEAVQQWQGRAIVTAHGRTFRGAARWGEWVDAARFSDAVDDGRFVNYGGTGVMAFDTWLRVPSEWPHRNCLDAQLALWAQQHQVPMWLLPHAAGWISPLVVGEEGTIYATDKASGFARRNGVLEAHPSWEVVECPA